MLREIVEGKIQRNANGYAFLIPSNNKQDYFISHSDLRGAMHGDTVLCETCTGYGERTTARVLKIIERGIPTLTGTYFNGKGGGYVCPDDKKYFCDIFIPFGKGLRAKPGDKVVCRILSYPKKQRPEGMITKIFGRQFEKNAELKSILYTYNLPEKFKKEVLWEANGLSAEITKQDLRERKDFRDLVTFTIDGDDAKDFDDAVSIKKSGKNFILYVHIADVSHYVKEGSIIDKHAFERGTSVYFPESVIPMLPERLCNDLCSLKEGVDRLTFTCVMKIDARGNVLDSEILPSIINSNRRLTYSNVQKVLDGDKNLKHEYSDIYKQLKQMQTLSEILFSKREEQGTIDLDVKESRIFVDNGKIVVEREKRDVAHKIIEEFMILANTVVAEHIYYLELPFIYRIHEKPAFEKVEDFYAFLEGLGQHPKRKKDEIFPKDFQLILKNAEGKDYFYIVNRVMLRSMQKAKYSPENLGHFGLSLKCYTHFTSPIRRYPDLAIHRILKDVLAGSSDVGEKYLNTVGEIANHSSQKEKNAVEAERAVDDFYKVLYLSELEGEEFDGVISGVTKFGLFVELENGIEGLVKIETLRGKRFNFDPKTYTLLAGNKVYKLGNRVRIRVIGVNFADRKAEFEICEDISCKDN